MQLILQMWESFLNNGSSDVIKISTNTTEWCDSHGIAKHLFLPVRNYMFLFIVTFKSTYCKYKNDLQIDIKKVTLIYSTARTNLIPHDIMSVYYCSNDERWVIDQSSVVTVLNCCNQRCVIRISLSMKLTQNRDRPLQWFPTPSYLTLPTNPHSGLPNSNPSRTISAYKCTHKQSAVSNLYQTQREISNVHQTQRDIANVQQTQEEIANVQQTQRARAISQLKRSIGSGSLKSSWFRAI